MAGMCFDSDRGIGVLAGGWDSPNNKKSYYELDVCTDTWAYIGNAPWESRSHCRMAYDPIRQLVYLVGGYAYPQAAGSYRYRDTWSWAGATDTWTELSFGAGDDIPAGVNLVNSGTDRHFDIFWNPHMERICLLSSYDAAGRLILLSLDPATPKWEVDYDVLVQDIVGVGDAWTLSEIPAADYSTAERTIYCFFTPSQAAHDTQTWKLEGDGELLAQAAVTTEEDGSGPPRIGWHGGAVINLAHAWSTVSSYQVYLGKNGDDTDEPCYSGDFGQGYAISSPDGTTIKIVSPRLSLSDLGDCEISVYVAGSGFRTAYAPIDVVEETFSSEMFETRTRWPDHYDVGPRSLPLEEDQ
jgi:hypothetical protein